MHEKNIALNFFISLCVSEKSDYLAFLAFQIRRMSENGLIEKWLSDVMEWSKINEARQKSSSEIALVNLRKLYVALIALGVGYFLGFAALIGEILHWRYVVLRNPNYDKYHLDTFYGNNNKPKAS